MTPPPRIAVVGAGMAGLAAAWRLHQAGAQVQVFEREPVVGGRAATVAQDGFLIDTGAILLSSQYHRTLGLVRDVGLGQALLPGKPVLGIVRRGVIHELDMARPLGSFLRWQALSGRAKLGLLRAVPDLLRHWGRCGFQSMAPMAVLDGEDCRRYALRVLGQELHDYFVDPLIRVNMFSSTDRAPAADLIWLMRMFSNPAVLQLQGGMQRLPQALAARLPVRLGQGQGVAAVERVAAGVRMHLQDGATHDVDAAVLAVPPPVALTLAPWLQGQHRAFLAQAEPIRSVAVSFGLKQVPASRASIVMVPTAEQPDVLGLVLQHHKAADRAPPGRGLVTLHLRHAWLAALPDQRDTTIAAHARGLASQLLQQPAMDVCTTHIHHWHYVDYARGVGSYRALQQMQAEAPPDRVALAGEYRSAGIEGAVISGEAAAKQLLDAKSWP